MRSLRSMILTTNRGHTYYSSVRHASPISSTALVHGTLSIGSALSEVRPSIGLRNTHKTNAPVLIRCRTAFACEDEKRSNHSSVHDL